ncbi:MAG: hypothetical protein OXD30_10155 [Bryobacterales bacterium]|nr:hypothetical protein [Bryobacterales bacterium]
MRDPKDTSRPALFNRPGSPLASSITGNWRRTARPRLLAALACALCLASCSLGSRRNARKMPARPGPPPAQAEPAARAEAAPSDADAYAAAQAAAEAEAARSLLEIPPSLDPEELAASDEEIALLDELLELTLPDEAPKELSHEEALLHTRSELPLALTADVKRLLNYFTQNKRGMATIRVSLARGSAYRPMIERILAEEGVPREIYYLAMAESGFRPMAHSHARELPSVVKQFLVIQYLRPLPL